MPPTEKQKQASRRNFLILRLRGISTALASEELLALDAPTCKRLQAEVETLLHRYIKSTVKLKD